MRGEAGLLTQAVGHLAQPSHQSVRQGGCLEESGWILKACWQWEGISQVPGPAYSFRELSTPMTQTRPLQSWRAGFQRTGDARRVSNWNCWGSGGRVVNSALPSPEHDSNVWWKTHRAWSPRWSSHCFFGPQFPYLWKELSWGWKEIGWLNVPSAMPGVINLVKVDLFITSVRQWTEGQGVAHPSYSGGAS